VNERIKQLGVQSKMLQHINGMKRYNNQDKIEKFAELIVRECVDVAIDNGCGDFVDINQLLLKHFGYE